MFLFTSPAVEFWSKGMTLSSALSIWLRRLRAHVCVCVRFMKCLKSPLSTVCPVPAELGLDSAVLVDKSIHGSFLSLSAAGIWVWIICCGDCRCSLEWLAALLASSQWVPVTSRELGQPKISLGLCQKSPAWQKSPRSKVAG